MSRRTWPVARGYAAAPLAVGLPLLVSGRRRSGWVGIGLAAAVLSFFRDPERALQADPELVYSAADGVVTAVDDKYEDEWMPGGYGSRVSVFLSLHNVHVSRSPVTGRLERMEELGGGFAPALFASAVDNRRNRLLFDADGLPVVVVQMAGAVARRITSWVQPGDHVAAGQRLGIIHFGSRTDVLLPVDAGEVLVRPGQRVLAGRTPLFRLRRDSLEGPVV